MNKSESIKELAAAMSIAQSSMGGAHKGAENPFFKSSYADLSSVVEAVKDHFTKNGLSYVQFPINNEGRVGVETVLMHKSGEWISSEFTVQLTKQDAQGAGSAITYCRRYALQAVAGIPSEDDDGNAASQKKTDKSIEIAKVAKECGWTVEEVLLSFGDNPRLKSLNEIQRPDECINYLKQNKKG